jgi:hypothetical protein
MFLFAFLATPTTIENGDREQWFDQDAGLQPSPVVFGYDLQGPFTQWVWYAHVAMRARLWTP